MSRFMPPDARIAADRLTSALRSRKKLGQPPQTTQEAIADPKRALPIEHCGFCPAAFRIDDTEAIREHDLSHRARTKAEQAQAEANRAAARIMTLKTITCELCLRETEPGSQHACVGMPPNAVAQQKQERKVERERLRAFLSETD